MRHLIPISIIALLVACGGSDGTGDGTTEVPDAPDADSVGGDVVSVDSDGDGEVLEDTAEPSDAEDVTPGDTAPGDTAPGDTAPDTALTDTTTPDVPDTVQVDDATDAVDDADDTSAGDTVADVAQDIVLPPCEIGEADPCDTIFATRCNPTDPTFIDVCDSVDGCLAWVTSSACDVNLCTDDVDVCVDGECVPSKPSLVKCPPDPNPCISNACDPQTGACVTAPAEPGTPCDDGFSCTSPDGCFNGTCQGTNICPVPCVTTEIGCGEWVDVQLTSGGTDLMNGYSCDGVKGASDGWERAFLLANANNFACPDLWITVEMPDPKQKAIDHVDLMLLGLGQGICNPDQCLKANVMDVNGRAQLKLNLPAKGQAGDKMVLVVDGRDDYAGSARVSVSCCGIGAEPFCSDGIDDDGDGSPVDCDDTDCSDSIVCDFEHQCGNDEDDDGDLKTDCADPDCAGSPDCIVETLCDDGVDNEPDGKTDCDDEDCFGIGDCGSACPDATPIACGETLMNQTLAAGVSTFSGQGWPVCGGAPSPITYTNPHQLYSFTSDTGCAAFTLSPSGGVFDFYLGAGACTTGSCVNGETQFFGDSVSAADVSAGWLAVFLDDSFYASLSASPFSVTLDCTCP